MTKEMKISLGVVGGLTVILAAAVGVKMMKQHSAEETAASEHHRAGEEETPDESSSRFDHSSRRSGSSSSSSFGLRAKSEQAGAAEEETGGRWGRSEREKPAENETTESETAGSRWAHRASEGEAPAEESGRSKWGHEEGETKNETSSARNPFARHETASEARAEADAEAPAPRESERSTRESVDLADDSHRSFGDSARREIDEPRTREVAAEETKEKEEDSWLRERRPATEEEAPSARSRSSITRTAVEETPREPWGGRTNAAELSDERERPTSAPRARNLITDSTYVVEKGDTLFDIARYELGKASRWGEIYELNQALIGDDLDNLRPGMELALPTGRGATGVFSQRRDSPRR